MYSLPLLDAKAAEFFLAPICPDAIGLTDFKDMVGEGAVLPGIRSILDTLQSSFSGGDTSCAKAIKSVSDHFTFYNKYLNKGGTKEPAVDKELITDIGQLFQNRFMEALKEFRLLHLYGDGRADQQETSLNEEMFSFDMDDQSDSDKDPKESGSKSETWVNQAGSWAWARPEKKTLKRNVDEVLGASFTGWRLDVAPFKLQRFDKYDDDASDDDASDDDASDDVASILQLYFRHRERVGPVLELFVQVDDHFENMRSSLLQRPAIDLISILDLCMTTMNKDDSSDNDSNDDSDDFIHVPSPKIKLAKPVPEDIDLVIEMLQDPKLRKDIKGIDTKLGEIVGPDGFSIKEVRSYLKQLKSSDVGDILNRCYEWMAPELQDVEDDETKKEVNIAMINQLLQDPLTRERAACMCPEISFFASNFDANNRTFMEAFTTLLKSFDVPRLGEITVDIMPQRK